MSEVRARGTRARRERRLAIGLALSLAALLAGIAGVTLLDARHAGGTPAPSEAVERIAIERGGREPIAIERRGDDWRVTAPCALDADEARLEPLLAALAGPRPDYAAGEVDLGAAGLDAPLATVRLDGEAVTLGATDLGGERRYARRGNRVALVPEWTLALVDGGLSALATLAPFDATPSAVHRLAAPAEAGSASAAASADPPDSLALDPLPWGELTASQIVLWPVPDAPAATARARLEATLADGSTRRLDVERNASWTALRVDGSRCAFLFGGDELPAETYR